MLILSYIIIIFYISFNIHTECHLEISFRMSPQHGGFVTRQCYKILFFHDPYKYIFYKDKHNCKILMSYLAHCVCTKIK